MKVDRRTFWIGVLWGLGSALGQGGGAVLSRKANEIAVLTHLPIDGGTAAYQRITGGLLMTVLAFVLFRLFDIAKPLGISKLQDLPGGWGVVVEREMDVYVIEADRRVAYVQELYLVEAARGTGIGRALLQACESWARAHAIPVMHIGVVAGNTRAHAVYQAAGFSDYAVDLRKRL